MSAAFKGGSRRRQPPAQRSDLRQPLLEHLVIFVDEHVKVFAHAGGPQRHEPVFFVEGSSGLGHRVIDGLLGVVEIVAAQLREVHEQAMFPHHSDFGRPVGLGKPGRPPQGEVDVHEMVLDCGLRQRSERCNVLGSPDRADPLSNGVDGDELLLELSQAVHLDATPGGCWSGGDSDGGGVGFAGGSS